MIEIYDELDNKVASSSDYEMVESDMGECSITVNAVFSTVKSFHPDWYIPYEGEKFSLDVRRPTGKKDTSSLSTSYTLVFNSERNNLKRYPFMDFVELGSGNPQPSSYTVALYATLTQFVDRFNLNLQYYLGSRWKMSLPEGYEEDGTFYNMSFSSASLWDVLLEVNTIFSIRWIIRCHDGIMDIILGNDTPEIQHVFLYGKNSGLISIERNNPLERIITRLRGVGSTNNLPPDYFHEGDPDTNTVLQNIYYPNLMPSLYRDYIRGYNAGTGEGTWAYNAGVADKVAGKPIAPIDYALSDKEALWGVSYGSIDANDDIFPTLQGIMDEKLGRLDEVVAVENSFVATPKPVDPNIIHSVTNTKELAGRDGGTGENGIPNCNGVDNKQSLSIDSELSSPISSGINTVEVSLTYTKSVYDQSSRPVSDGSSFIVSSSVYLENKETGERTDVVETENGKAVFENLPAGEYSIHGSVSLYNGLEALNLDTCNITAVLSGKVYEYKLEIDKEAFKQTFDIWIKNIWNTAKLADESEEDYAYRVWSPLAVSDEMTVMFSDGLLAGEDYEFMVAGFSKDSESLRQNIIAAIHHDTSKVTADGIRSEWRLSLQKSDAELEASGMYLPNDRIKAKAGDHFFFINIKMPYDPYVFNAETRLTSYLEEQLALKDDESPTFTITPSNIFCRTFDEVDKLRAGSRIRIQNADLIGEDYITIYIQSVTRTYSKDAKNPSWSLTVTDEIMATGNPVETLSGEVTDLSNRINIAQMSNKELMRFVQGLFLRKDGIDDVSYSPTDFEEIVRIGEKGLRDKDFASGDLSGRGFAVYTDDSGNRVVEADILVGRIGARFNEVVINQTTYTGGKQVFSGAGMTVSEVEQTEEGWRCYFDTKNGTVRNMFQIGDGAFCQRFTDAGPITYWRRVTGIGSNYIDISSTDCMEGSAEPSSEDNIAHLGNDRDRSRQAAFIIDEVRDGGGLVTWYDDISGYTLDGKDSVNIGRIDGKTWLKVYGSGYIGARDESQYVKFENGVLKIKGVIDASSPVGDKGSIGDLIGGSADLDYLKKALNESTVIAGGLILTSAISLGRTINGVFTEFSGISGQYSDKELLGDIATWYGGTKETAKTVFRFDGSGYLANGKISWDAAGNMTFAQDINIGSDRALSSIITALNNISSSYLSKEDAEKTYLKKSYEIFGSINEALAFAQNTDFAGKLISVKQNDGKYVPYIVQDAGQISTIIDFSAYVKSTTVGSLSELITDNKDNIVSAINEVKLAVGTGGGGSAWMPRWYGTVDSDGNATKIGGSETFQCAKESTGKYRFYKLSAEYSTYTILVTPLLKTTATSISPLSGQVVAVFNEKSGITICMYDNTGVLRDHDFSIAIL